MPQDKLLVQVGMFCKVFLEISIQFLSLEGGFSNILNTKLLKETIIYVKIAFFAENQ